MQNQGKKILRSDIKIIREKNGNIERGDTKEWDENIGVEDTKELDDNIQGEDAKEQDERKENKKEEHLCGTV